MNRYFFVCVFFLFSCTSQSAPEGSKPEPEYPLNLECERFHAAIMNELGPGLACLASECGTTEFADLSDNPCVHRCGVFASPSGWPDTAAIIRYRPVGDCSYLFESPIEVQSHKIATCLISSANLSISLGSTGKRRGEDIADLSIRTLQACEGVVDSKQLCPHVHRTLAIAKTSRNSEELLSLYQKNCSALSAQ